MKNEIRVVPTFELLSEMEELMILGGEGDTVIMNGVKGCNQTNTFCGDANCNCIVHPIPTPTPVDPIPAQPRS